MTKRRDTRPNAERLAAGHDTIYCDTCGAEYWPNDEGCTVDHNGTETNYCDDCMNQPDANLFYCGHCYTTYHTDDEDREHESVCIYCARDERERRTN